MMKWKARTETTNIGVLELGNLTLNEDYMEITIDICDMSDNLKAEVEKVIETEKASYSEKLMRYLEVDRKSANPYERNTKWSNKPVIMDFLSLRIVLASEKPNTYSIEFGFHDAEDESMEIWGNGIDVDLSEYTNELKKAIIKVLVDKFF